MECKRIFCSSRSVETECERIFWSSRYVEMECDRIFWSSRYVEMVVSTYQTNILFEYLRRNGERTNVFFKQI